MSRLHCFSRLVQRALVVTGIALLVGACDKPVNSPQALAEYEHNTLFSSFSGRSPKTLDPQVSYSSDESLYTYAVYETLYGYHYLKRPYEIVPRTAERLVEPTYLDREGRVLPSDAAPETIATSVYRIPIKKGVKFAPHPAFARDEQGRYQYHALSPERSSALDSPLQLEYHQTRELTAHDYAYGIKRLANPLIVSPLLSVMAPTIVGLDDLAKTLRQQTKAFQSEGWVDMRRYDCAGIRAIDDYTIELRIHGKYPQFVNWLTMNFFAPVPWEAERFYANEHLRRNNISLSTWPVGTGPYYLAESKQNRRHVLARNPNYRVDPYPCEGEQTDRDKGLLVDCGKPMPFIDSVVMQLEKEAVPTTTKFLQGYYDSPQISRVDTGQGYLVAAQDDPNKAKLYESKKLQFPTTVEASVWYMGFNWLDPVVGGGTSAEQAERNRKLRQAISIAVDWEEQIAIFEKGQGQAAHGPLPPSLFGWRDDGVSAFNPVVYRRDADGRVVRRSIEEAKELMRQAGYPNGRDAQTGKPLVLNFDWQGTSPGSKAFLDWFSRQFAKIGIQLEIRATDYNRFQDKMNKGVAQIYYWGWLADYPDAENFLFLLYGPNSKAGSGSGGENASNFRHARYDRLFEVMKMTPDGPAKQRLIDEMISIAQHEAPWSFGYYPTSAAALHHWVKNAKPTSTVRNNIQYLRIDAQERAKSIAQWNQPIVWPWIALIFVGALGAWSVRRHVRRNAGASARRRQRIRA